MLITITKTREYLFYLLIFTLPWQTRWIIRDPLIGGEVWEYGRISLYGWDIILVVLLLLNIDPILKVLNGYWWKMQEFKNQKSKIKILLEPVLIYFLLLLFTLTSVWWAGDKFLALAWSLRLLEAGLVGLLILAIKPRLLVICWSLAAAGTVQALWGIGQFITQSTFASKWLGVAIHPLTQYGTSVVLTDMGRWLRAYAGQVHPNVLGGLLVITCLATIYLIIKNYKFKILNFKSLPVGRQEISKSKIISKKINSYSYLLLLLYIIQLAGLFFTFSRAAWLALFITLIIYFVELGRKNVRPDQKTTSSNLGLNEKRCYFGKQAAIILGCAFLVFITLGIILWPPTAGRILGGSRLENKSVAERVTSVQDSKKIIAQNWWRGTGIGNYTYNLQKFIPEQKANYYQPVHNVFLLILAELGVVGLLLLLWLIWLLARLKPLAIGHWPLAAVFITALFDHYWWTVPSMFLLGWLVLNIISPNMESQAS